MGEITDSHAATNEAKVLKKKIQSNQVPTSASKAGERPRWGNVVYIPSTGIYQPVYSTPSGLNWGTYGSGSLNNNYIIAGHSSYVSGVWFSSLFQLSTSEGYVPHDGTPYRPSDYKGGNTGKGGSIYIYTHWATYQYVADEAYTVEATDNTVTAQGKSGDHRELHLYTCPYTRKYRHPPFRYVVSAHLVEVRPTVAGRQAKIQTQLMVK